MQCNRGLSPVTAKYCHWRGTPWSYHWQPVKAAWKPFVRIHQLVGVHHDERWSQLSSAGAHVWPPLTTPTRQSPEQRRTIHMYNPMPRQNLGEHCWYVYVNYSYGNKRDLNDERDMCACVYDTYATGAKTGQACEQCDNSGRTEEASV